MNKAIKSQDLLSSSFTGGIRQVSDALCSNTTLENFVSVNVTGTTDEDMPHLSNMLVGNMTLKALCLSKQM